MLDDECTLVYSFGMPSRWPAIPGGFQREKHAMTSEQLKATVRQQPFRPFTIRMVDGRTFAVTHPDFVMVSPTGRTAILFEPDDSYRVVDLMLMNELDVSAPKPAG